MKRVRIRGAAEGDESIDDKDGGERDEGVVADEGGNDSDGERSEESVGEEEGGGFEKVEEIDWLLILFFQCTVELSVKMKFRDALNNAE